MRVVLHLVLLLVLVVGPSWRAQSSSYVCHAEHQWLLESITESKSRRRR